MTEFTAEEARKRNIEKMGQELGDLYSALWQETVQLHRRWSEYTELFGSKPSRVELLNNAAGTFFRYVQDSFWEGTLMHIARLTDPPVSAGKTNLTIKSLPGLVDAKWKPDVEQLVEEAVGQAAFARDWRNRLLAHLDLDLRLDKSATPLADASLKQARLAIDSIAHVLNEVEADYLDSTTAYDLGGPLHGAVSLLYVLHDGVAVAKEREERLARGEFSKADFQHPDL
jgi:hypothetical protein